MTDKAKMDAIKADYRAYLVECGEEPVVVTGLVNALTGERVTWESLTQGRGAAGGVTTSEEPPKP